MASYVPHLKKHLATVTAGHYFQLCTLYKLDVHASDTMNVYLTLYNKTCFNLSNDQILHIFMQIMQIHIRYLFQLNQTTSLEQIMLYHVYEVLVVWFGYFLQ